MNSDLFRGLEIIKPKFFKDERGYFFESFNKKIFKNKISHKLSFCQENESFSKRGVIRGLHYQLPPYAQSKLINVTEGEIFDVAVDIRKSSATFGKWVGVYLSASNKKQLWVPEGFAHGFLVVSKVATVNYKVDNYYNKKSERSIIWNDDTLKIKWPIKEHPILSKSDESNMNFKNAQFFE